MRVVLLDARAPFAPDGALAAGLADALRGRGHAVDTVSVPFGRHPPERVLDGMLASRLLSVAEGDGRGDEQADDLAIGLAFPAYLIPHPNKTLWVARQFAPAYRGPEGEASAGHPLDDQVCEAVRQADRACFGRAQRVFAASRVVADRIRGFCGVDVEILPQPPPDAERLRIGAYGPYFYCPGGTGARGRHALVLEALARAGGEARVVFGGAWEAADLMERAARLGVEGRVAWRGRVDDAERIALLAECRAVLSPDGGGDHGHEALEAMLSGKAVVTCRDAGGARAFVADGDTGYSVDPDPEPLAAALGRLHGDPAAAERMGRAGWEAARALDLSWDRVAERLAG